MKYNSYLLIAFIINYFYTNRLENNINNNLIINYYI